MNKNSPKVKVSPKALGLIIIVLIVGIFIFLQLSQLPSGQLKMVDRASQLAKPIPTTTNNNGECEAGETGSADCQCDGSAIEPGEECEEEEPEEPDTPQCPDGQISSGLGCQSRCGAVEIWDGDSCETIRTCPAGTNNVNGNCLVPCLVSNYDRYPCRSLPPLPAIIKWRAYDPMSGQTVDAWLRGNTGWQEGNIPGAHLAGTLLGFFQIKWDATNVIDFRETYRSQNGPLYTYSSKFSNCRLDYVIDGIGRKLLSAGESGTYTGIMDIDRWLGGGPSPWVEVACDNTVTRFGISSQALVTETQKAGETISPNAQIQERIYSEIAKLNGGATQCEVPFDQIVKSLNSGAITKITEKGFRDWAKTDSFDDCDYNIDGTCKKKNPTAYANRELIRRSGAVDDIKTAMVMGHCSNSHAWSGDRETIMIDSTKFILDVENILRVGYPIPMGLSLIDNNGQTSAHAVIALGASHTGNTPNRIYTVFILDPNPSYYSSSQLKRIECYERDSEGLIDITFIGCNYPDDLSPDSIGIPGRLNMVNINEASLQNTFHDYCLRDRRNILTRFCMERTRYINGEYVAGVAGWLMDSDKLPSIVNFSSPESPDGTCYGWMDFVLKVAYLGDFTGECPHPLSISIP